MHSLNFDTLPLSHSHALSVFSPQTKPTMVLLSHLVGNLTKKFQPMRNKTNRENTRQRKQSHAQDNIYVVRQFAICLRLRSCKDFTIIRKKYKMLLQCFSLSKNDNNDNNKTLITKNVFYILRTGPSLCSMD